MNNANLSNRYLSERLYSLNNLRIWGTPDQVATTKSLYDEYAQEAKNRGLDPLVLIASEQRKVAKLFVASVFGD